MPRKNRREGGSSASALARPRTKSARTSPKRRPGPSSKGSPERDLESARRVLDIEATALRRLGRRLDHRFTDAIDLLVSCRGKVVVVGMGKSGQIGRKIASTLASTGTPAFFVHAAEGLHGDSGMIMKGDVVIALSNSGETEIVRLLPLLKRLHLPLIAMTGKPASTLGAAADVVLDTSVVEEACPLNLAPTASTTVTLALGDAIAIALLERKSFRAEDFAVFHPGGRLGRRLLRVDEIIHTGGTIPVVHESATLAETLEEMTSKRLGTTGIVDADGRLVGVITDGDLRRALQRHGNLWTLAARELMTTRPKTIAVDALAEEALATMEEQSITSLFVLESGTGRPVGIVHMHDLLKAGVV